MKFRGEDQWFRESECGTFRIVKVGINGNTRYETWQKCGAGWKQVRVNLPSFESAQEYAAGKL